MCQASSNTITAALINSLILTFPDPNEPYILFTDASKHSWLGVLTQECITHLNDNHFKAFLPITHVH